MVCQPMATSNVEDLMKQAEKLLAAGQYDLPLFVELFRGFQFADPKQFSLPLAARALLSAIARFDKKSNDFSVLLFMMHEAHHGTPEIKALCEMDDAVERARFASFWELYAKHRELFGDELPNFVTTVRAAMVTAISRAFQTVEAAALVPMLDVADADAVHALLTKAKVGEVQGETAVLAHNVVNAPPPTVEVRQLTSKNVAELVRLV